MKTTLKNLERKLMGTEFHKKDEIFNIFDNIRTAVRASFIKEAVMNGVPLKHLDEYLSIGRQIYQPSGYPYIVSLRHPFDGELLSDIYYISLNENREVREIYCE